MVVKREVTFQFEPEIYDHCLSEPEPPAGERITTADRRDWEADLVAWGRDCQAKVNGGADWKAKRRQELNQPTGQ